MVALGFLGIKAHCPYRGKFFDLQDLPVAAVCVRVTLRYVDNGEDFKK